MLKELREFDKTYLYDKRITQFIDRDDLWKLGVDAKDHCYGRHSYDEGTNADKIAEPNYIDAMETGLAFMFRTIGEELTPDYIKNLHQICCSSVRGAQTEIANISSKVKYQGGRQPLLKGEVTKEGIEEIAEWKFAQAFVFSKLEPVQIHYLTSKNINEFYELLQEGGYGESKVNYDIDEADLTREYLEEMATWNYAKVSAIRLKPKFHKLTLSPDNVTEFFNFLHVDKNDKAIVTFETDVEQYIKIILSEYYQAIQKAHDDDRLLAISKLAKKIEYLHPFIDGNTRTIRLVLLKLLIENGFDLTYIYNPNLIDGYSSKQIVGLIKEGFALKRDDQSPAYFINSAAHQLSF